MKSPRAAKGLRTRRRQLCIKWRVDARGMSFHIWSTSKRKSDRLQTMVLGLFDSRLMKHHTLSKRFRSDSNKNFCLANSKLSQLLGAAGPWYSQCAAWVHRARIWLVLQRVVVKMWHSLSVEDLVKIPPGVHVCPGSRICNYGKGTTTPWRRRLRSHIVAGHGPNGDA